MRRYGLGSCRLGQEQVAGSCEHGNKCSGPIKLEILE
jgi:hypothetical protein